MKKLFLILFIFTTSFCYSQFYKIPFSVTQLIEGEWKVTGEDTIVEKIVFHKDYEYSGYEDNIGLVDYYYRNGEKTTSEYSIEQILDKGQEFVLFLAGNNGSTCFYIRTFNGQYVFLDQAFSEYKYRVILYKE